MTSQRSDKNSTDPAQSDKQRDEGTDSEAWSGRKALDVAIRVVGKGMLKHVSLTLDQAKEIQAALATLPELGTINAAPQADSTNGDAIGPDSPAVAAPAEGPTPRTDALCRKLFDDGNVLWSPELSNHARQLERELAEYEKRGLDMDAAQLCMSDLRSQIIELEAALSARTERDQALDDASCLMLSYEGLLDQIGGTSLAVLLSNRILALKGASTLSTRPALDVEAAWFEWRAKNADAPPYEIFKAGAFIGTLIERIKALQGERNPHTYSDRDWDLIDMGAAGMRSMVLELLEETAPPSARPLRQP